MTAKEIEATANATEEAKVKTEVPEKKEVAETTEKPTETPPVEEKKDVEEDSPDDARPKIAQCEFDVCDTTLNALVSEGTVVSSLREGGLHLLLTAARGRVGVKTGRYYYEVKVIDVEKKPEVRVGFSTKSSSLFFGDDDEGFAFDINGSFAKGKGTKNLGKRWKNSDVVGILLNRGEEKTTLSLFINGERATDPEEIKVTGALYPHISFCGCALAVNFKNLWKPLSFKVRMLGGASKADCELSKSKVPEVPEVVIPVGFDNETWAEEFAKEHTSYSLLTRKSFRLWGEKSQQRTIPALQDFGAVIASLFRNRHYVVALSDNLLPPERKNLCQRFGNAKKVAKVFVGTTERVIPTFNTVCLPTDGEGFDLIEYVKPKEECENALEEWKSNCKLQSRVDDLKAGPWFKEQLAEWKKFVAEKKKEKEGDFKDFQDEDWMLADLRAEMHLLLHAFVTDVNDPSRLGFAPTHFVHYYKVYTSLAFNVLTFGQQSAQELTELIGDVMTLQKGLFVPSLEKDTEKLTFLELTLKAQTERQDRLDAGDENAALPFSAKKMPPPFVKPIKGQGKGNRPVQPPRTAQGPLRTVPQHKRPGTPLMWGNQEAKRFQRG